MVSRFKAWVAFRVARAKGEIPWWWESDRRTSLRGDDPEAEALFYIELLKAKREGLY